MNQNSFKKENTSNTLAIDILKPKVDDSKSNYNTKTKADCFGPKINKIPTFIPQSFQDYAEKLNEKSGLWRRKYIMLFLKLKRIFFYDKKPGEYYMFNFYYACLISRF
jgi:hypothetical protein